MATVQLTPGEAIAPTTDDKRTTLTGFPAVSWLSAWGRAQKQARDGVASAVRDVLWNAWLIHLDSQDQDAGDVALASCLRGPAPATPLNALSEGTDALCNLLAATSGAHEASRALEIRCAVAQFRSRVLRVLLQRSQELNAADVDATRLSMRTLVHDASNLLSAVCGNVDYVEQMGGELAQGIREALQDAATAGRTLQDVISRAGDVVALEQARLTPARWVRTDNFLRALKLSPSFRVDVANAGAQVFCRDATLTRTLRFLCTKAAAVSTPQRPPQLRVERVDASLRITITDGGTAVSQTVLAAMTQRVWRGENVETARADRSQGYYLASLVAAAHGGVLAISSPESGGMQIEIVLPQPAS